MTTIDTERQSDPLGMAKLREFWNIVVRRKWVVISSIILSLTAAGSYCALATKYYRSTTLIFMEEPKIAQKYSQIVAEPEFEERFFAIQKQIMSRKLLGEIADEFKLYPDFMARRGLEATGAAMRRDVMVEMIDKVPGAKFTSRKKSVEAFTISFVHGDPTTAMEVTARIASKFIEESLKAREESAKETTGFFNTEIARTKSELERKDDEIKRFKSKHMGELPEQVAANLHTLDRLQNDLKAVNEAIHRLSDRQSMVEKSMQDYHKFGTTNGALTRTSTEPDPLYRRLKELKEKLGKLRAEFWEGYPEVLLTNEEIRQVERELVALYGLDAIKQAENGRKPLDPYLQDLKKQESETKTELAVLMQRQELLHAEKKLFEVRVERAPTIEQELQTLMRDYDNLKRNYQALLEKQLNARVDENLEKRQQGTQFRILDSASMPVAPESPKTGLILVFAFLFGSTLGVGIAVIQEQQNPQFRRAEDVEQSIGRQVLAVIPDFANLCDPKTWKQFIPYYGPVSGGKGESDGIGRQLIAGPQLVVQGQSGLPLESSIIVNLLPKSIMADQYRVAASRLAFDRVKERSTIVCVTSAVQGEGKTTTVVNLGYTLARDLGKRTVLVDCDFRRPALAKYMDTVPAAGLADCFRNNASLDDCLFGFPGVPCWVMAAGKCEDASNELLKTDRLHGIVAQLRDRFEYILINAPPILSVADMNVITGYVDVILVVVRAASTPQDYVKRALYTIGTDKPLHIILNGARGQYLPQYFQEYVEPVYGGNN